ncbi:hypothetical protein JCM10212_003405 [Sporobolomyces blumeae]
MRSLEYPDSTIEGVPTYVLRGHQSPISTLCFSRDGHSLYSADSQGYVARWDLGTLRPTLFWKAHSDGVLTIRELDDGRAILTHGRDNVIHCIPLPHPRHGALRKSSLGKQAAPTATSVPSPLNPSHRAGTASTSTTAPRPGSKDDTDNDDDDRPRLTPLWTMDVNALNFCQLDLVELDADARDGSPLAHDDVDESKSKGKKRVPVDPSGLIAVPSLTKDDFVDIFHLPSFERLHRSVGMGSASIGHKTGSVMAVRLFYLDVESGPQPSSRTGIVKEPALHLLIGYESGQVCLFRFAPTRNFVRDRPTTGSGATATVAGPSIERPIKGKVVEEGEGWELVWDEKRHRDAVMSIAITSDKRFAYSVGADHLVAKYRIFDLNEVESTLERSFVESTPSPGKSTLALRNDDKLVATAGWDGEVRLYSAKTLQPLAVLSHHRQAVQAVAFAPVVAAVPGRRQITRSAPSRAAVDDDDDREGQGPERSRSGARRWIVVDDDDDDDDDESSGPDSSDSSSGPRPRQGERTKRGTAWLASAGQDAKICLWVVYPPSPPQ